MLMMSDVIVITGWDTDDNFEDVNELYKGSSDFEIMFEKDSHKEFGRRYCLVFSIRALFEQFNNKMIERTGFGFEFDVNLSAKIKDMDEKLLRIKIRNEKLT
jgi:hypothetical protein